MHVLVMGGTRYFGQAAVEQLLADGHRVSIFSRGNVRPDFWDDIEHIAGDRTDADGMARALQGREFDGVIDNQCYDREEAASVIDALAGRVGRYVVASTVSVYGEGGHATGRSTVRTPLTDAQRFAADYRVLEPIREDALDNRNHPWEYRPDLAAYAEGKRHMERVMLESDESWPYVIVRVPATLGPNDPSGRFAWWLTRILDGGPILLPDGGVHAVQLGYSRDLARFLIRLLEDSPTRTIYNYAQPESPSLVHWLGCMATAAGKPLNAVSVPSEIVQQATDLPWEEWSYAPFSSTPILMSTSKAESEIGLEFRVSLMDWMQTTVDACLGDPAALESAKHGECRPAEIEFANRWTAARDELLARWA